MLMGETLPEPARSKVLELISDIPQIKPVFAQEGRPRQDIRRDVMVAERDMNVRAVAEFRLDDDDAVAVDFVERTRDFFYKVKGIYRNGGKLALDFNRGFILRTDLSGVKLFLVTARNWTPGLVLNLRPQSDESLLHFNHAQMWKRIPMLSFPRVPMFLRGAHGENDSSVSYKPHNSEDAWFDKDKLSEIMQERFNIPLDRLSAAWDAALSAE